MWEIIGMAVLVFVIVMAFVVGLGYLISEVGNLPETKKDKAAPKRKAEDLIRKGYVAMDYEAGVMYVMDASNIEHARLIIRFDGRGVWKTEDGKYGPWILEAEVKDGY